MSVVVDLTGSDDEDDNRKSFSVPGRYQYDWRAPTLHITSLEDGKKYTLDMQKDKDRSKYAHHSWRLRLIIDEPTTNQFLADTAVIDEWWKEHFPDEWRD